MAIALTLTFVSGFYRKYMTTPVPNQPTAELAVNNRPIMNINTIGRNGIYAASHLLTNRCKKNN